LEFDGQQYGVSLSRPQHVPELINSLKYFKRKSFEKIQNQHVKPSALLNAVEQAPGVLQHSKQEALTQASRAVTLNNNAIRW
jgi:hypothetical protein